MRQFLLLIAGALVSYHQLFQVGDRYAHQRVHDEVGTCIEKRLASLGVSDAQGGGACTFTGLYA